MTLREAAEKALEAFNSGHKHDLIEAEDALREALAQPEQEPVAWVAHGDIPITKEVLAGGILLDVGEESDYSPKFVSPLYLHPAPIPEWKDHNTAQLVNELTEIAVKYRDMQQLRERIAHVIRPLAEKAKVPEGWQLVPIAPTGSMEFSGKKAIGALHQSDARDCYKAMLAAAPKPEE